MGAFKKSLPLVLEFVQNTLTAGSPCLVTMLLYYLAETAEDNWKWANNNWTAANENTYNWTRANQR